MEKEQFKANLLELYKGFFLKTVMLTLTGQMEVFKPKLRKWKDGLQLFI